jgi:hypothetical protein
MTADMTNNVEYVLPLGSPADEGGMTNPSWYIFVQWILKLTDHLIIWTHASREEVEKWFNLLHTPEIETIIHPDPSCALKGYSLNRKLLALELVFRIRVSEESGVAYFAWTKCDAVLASIKVQDFENFAILNVELADAQQLAVACAGLSWDRERILEYRREINALSTSDNWILISDLLNLCN